MTRLPFVTLDVFTDRRFDGNPLAVVFDAEGLDDEVLAAVAREFNLSETAFVSAATRPGSDATVRIFTPVEELPFAGHPTIGTAVALTLTGRAEPGRLVLDEGVGPVEVEVTDGGRRARLTAARPAESSGSDVDPVDLAAAVGLDPADVVAESAALSSCGVPFLCVEVVDVAALARAEVVPDAWRAALAGSAARWPYWYTAGGTAPGELRCRMFAPGLGFAEDPATGAAACALGGLLAERAGTDGEHRWVLHQGVELGRPSRLEVSVDVTGGVAARPRVGGAAVLVAEGTLYL